MRVLVTAVLAGAVLAGAVLAGAVLSVMARHNELLAKAVAAAVVVATVPGVSGAGTGSTGVGVLTAAARPRRCWLLMCGRLSGELSARAAFLGAASLVLAFGQLPRPLSFVFFSEGGYIFSRSTKGSFGSGSQLSGAPAHPL